MRYHSRRPSAAGLDGDATAQAIQLRMRAADQDLVSMTRIRAWNSAGKNPVMILDITSNVTSGAAGSRILLATSGFTTKVKALNSGFAPDFTMAHPIPKNYLAAGRLTFERDTGEILWSVAWGGSSYTGTNLGTRDNDVDGNFGPAFANALPTSSRQGVRFKGIASAKSTTNAADYSLSPDPAAVVRNDGISFTIGPVPEIVVVQPLGSSCSRPWLPPPSLRQARRSHAWPAAPVPLSYAASCRLRHGPSPALDGGCAACGAGAAAAPH